MIYTVHIDIVAQKLHYITAETTNICTEKVKIRAIYASHSFPSSVHICSYI
jgi:hypothetical protein